jgi:hypothetical protein
LVGELTPAVWEVSAATGARKLLVRARSTQTALKVGGGHWFAPWVASAAMAQPLRGAAALPLDVSVLAARLPRALQPPGL